ncbi:MAG: carboxypeptidase-like regulatory domain-containing protein, partial [Bacteroidales bacterium]|nr:carboxypeptidase-like regulatory domain-containing protein [Bacteroidales bacterium]
MRLKNFVILLAMAILAIPAYAQMKVSGVVVQADDGEPVIGATIKVKGSPAIGAATDLDGKFTLSVPSSKSVLIVSYVGMTTKEVKASANMKISLESSSQQLQEVVVTGMQKMDKRMFTGATTQISASEAKLDGVADISRSLEG